ncbi:hypothetical protein CYMTET_29036 [Cymbomonas tetramitiformis]|uniref:EML-like second beta-propeller domain-containing protein n=1 Tax=Cymbomonas tetramitiformis TaxID=36881 RepID=A0AAE0FLL8_9CHLO|nr:hypothetical protein CYMTET_29036 [Cymbomonas tetramitiformis]
MSNSQSYEILYWNAATGAQIKESMRDVQWDTWTCVLGFPVMGIWPLDGEGAHGTDVNSVDRSPSHKYVVTADDRNQVKLFNYPCVVRQAPNRMYRGHASHVLHVRFSPDETHLVSVGGVDRAIFQWRVVPDHPPPQGNVGSAPYAQS